MKILLVLCLIRFIIRTDAFDCSASTNMSGNAMDYRSFYVCDKQCPLLTYCQPPQVYFSNETKTCVSEPDNWIPRYYLSGTVQPVAGSVTILYLRQDGYKILWTYDDLSTSETFTGRYLNETYAQGILARRLLTTNCINIFDVELTATADRNYCAVHRLHPQSALCDKTYPNELKYCRTLSV